MPATSLGSFWPAARSQASTQQVAAALEYRDPPRQRHHYYQEDAPLPPPVPALPQRRGPSCACSLACVALLGCVAFSACMLVELSYVNLDTGGAATALQRRRDYARHMREQQHKLGTATPPVRLGLWDENVKDFKHMLPRFEVPMLSSLLWGLT